MRDETKPRRVVLALHGDERLTRGGPSVRVPRMAELMRAQEIDARVLALPHPDILSADVVHGFNVWNPHSALSMARQVQRMGKPFVFSPIFLDLGETDLWNRRLPSLFERNLDNHVLDDLIAAEVREFASDDHIAPRQPLAGYHAAVRELIDLSDHVIHLSQFEQRALENIGATASSSSIIRNPIAAEDFENADPLLFQERYGLRDFVLCVARIEPRKNQLMLLHALRDLHLPVVLVGDEPNPAYSALLDRYVTDRVHRLGRLERENGMLQSALAAARVVALPSWAEGAPLSALEAAAAGAGLVLSDRSGEAEYLEGHATYCDPASPQSIRKAVLKAWDLSPNQRRTAQFFVRERYSWDRHIRETIEAYGTAARRRRSANALPPPPQAIRAGALLLSQPNPDLESAVEFSDAERLAWRTLERLGGRRVSIQGLNAEQDEPFVEAAQFLVFVCARTTPRPETAECIRTFAEANRLKLIIVMPDGIPLNSNNPSCRDDSMTDDFHFLARESSQIICNSAESQDFMARYCVAEDIVMPRIDFLSDFDDVGALGRLLVSETPAWDVGDIYLSGDRLSLERASPRRGVALEQGWFARGKAAVWSKAPSARLSVNARSTGLSILAISASMPISQREIGVCKVHVDGVQIGTAFFADSEPRTFAFPLPSPTTKRSVSVDFVVDRMRIHDEEDRPVGMALHALALETPNEPFMSLEQERTPPGRVFDLTHWTSASLLVEGASQDNVWGMHGRAGVTRFILGRAMGEDEKDARLLLRCRPVASPSRPLQAKVLVNGRQVGTIETSSDEVLDWEFAMPEDDLGSACRVIDVIAPDDRSPASLGLGKTDRAFAVGLFAATLVNRKGRDLPVIRRVGRINLGNDADDSVEDSELPPGEWHGRESHGRWSNGASGQLRLVVPETTLDGYMVRIRASCGPISGRSRVLALWVGDRMIAHRKFGESGEILEGFVPRDALQNSALHFRLTTDSGFTPWVESGTPDDRRLGFYLQQVEVKAAHRPNVVRDLARAVRRRLRAARTA